MPDPAPARRSVCPLDYALAIFGDRWTLLVVRDLLFGGKRRFGEMLESGEKIATNILSDRLKRLEALDFVTRRPDPGNRRQVLYEPTAKCVDLAPALLEIIRWSADHDPETVVPDAMRRRMARDREGLLEELLHRGRARREEA